MEAKIVILTKAETKKSLEDAKCPPGIINRIGADLHLWWKTGWIQEILLAQKRAGMREVVEFVEQNYAFLHLKNSERWQAYKKKLGI